MSELIFKEKEHQYFYEGQELISVTTVIHKYAQEFNTEEVLDKMLKGSNVYAGKNKKYFGMSRKEIKQNWIDVNKEATDYGTAVHLMAEDYVLGNECSNEFPSELEQVVNFFKDSGFKCHTPEIQLFSLCWGIAGTADLLLEKNGKYHVADYKTNRGKDLGDHIGNQHTEYMKYPCNMFPDLAFFHYSIQMSVYRYLLESEERYSQFNEDNMGEMFIVHIKEGLTYPKIIYVPYLKNLVIKLLGNNLIKNIK